MSKKNKKTKRLPDSARAPHRPTDGESRVSVAVTVAWAMAALATFVAELLGTAAQLLQLALTDAGPAQLAAYLMLWIAVGTGIVTLLLTPIVWKYRESPAPAGVSTAVIVIAILPLVFAGFVLSR